jgi:seryl-tRNA synthetase
MMSKSEFDIVRAKSLAQEISANLAALPEDSAKYAELRAEVEDLKRMLAGTEVHLPQVEDQMKSVHNSFDRAATELRADGVRVGMFLKEIGRILGLD